MPMKIKKIMVWPSRTLDLGSRGYAKLSAGVEIELSPPCKPGSKRLKEAFEEARKVVREEFMKQYEPYKKKAKRKGGESNG